ncbi:MAG: MBL fold metallo-hydrolase [Verrucomicrobiales bacterium]|nr:MBL fold metallo-hydrolase [Verrucomicrobiales bacterium]
MRGVVSIFLLCFSLSCLAEEPDRIIRQNGAVLSFDGSGSEKADVILLTHCRRDVVEKSRLIAKEDAIIYAPESARPQLEGAEAHWQKWWQERFDYYGQQVTKLPLQNFPATHYLKDGDTFQWEGITFRFLDLPGYTRECGGYLVKQKDLRTACYTSKLILAGGKIPDLYSFQNEIPAAKIGNYHGYLGKAGSWLNSIRKLEREKLFSIVPARGEIIPNPEETLSLAKERIKAIYRNYLSTNALFWYFGEERMSAAAEAVLSENHGVKGMPLAEHIDLPEWCHHIGTTKLFISENNRGFALDVGGRNQFEALFKYLKTGKLNKLDGIFVTHTHNDHSAFVADAVAEFNCPVYSVKEVVEVLETPGAWHLPGVPDKSVARMITKLDRATMKWEEFTFTFRFFPGQMYHHGALLVEKVGETPVFFIGDSFSPSGIDDYCVMNRNLLHDDTGYLKCFEIVTKLPPGTWLVNQHINHRFRFSESDLSFLKASYLKRRDMIAEFVAWDDPNYGIDEQWASFFPYGQKAKPGETVEAEIRIWNHSPIKRTFEVTVHGTDSITPIEFTRTLTLPPRDKGSIKYTFHLDKNSKEGTHVITADVKSDPSIMERWWIEGLIRCETEE